LRHCFSAIFLIVNAAASRKRPTERPFKGNTGKADSALLLATQPVDFPSVNPKLISISFQSRDFAFKGLTQRIRQEDDVEVSAVSLSYPKLPGIPDLRQFCIRPDKTCYLVSQGVAQSFLNLLSRALALTGGQKRAIVQKGLLCPPVAEERLEQLVPSTGTG